MALIPGFLNAAVLNLELQRITLNHLSSIMSQPHCQHFELVTMAIVGMTFQDVFNGSAWEDWAF